MARCVKNIAWGEWMADKFVLKGYDVMWGNCRVGSFVQEGSGWWFRPNARPYECSEYPFALSAWQLGELQKMLSKFEKMQEEFNGR